MKHSAILRRVLAVTLALTLCIGLVPLSGLLSLETAAVNIVKPLGENMFLQGGFEGVDLRDWSTNVSGLAVLDQLSADAEHSDGTRGLQLVTGTNEGGVRATVYGLTSGATYQLALWAKAGTSDASTLRVALHQWTDSWGSDVKSATAISTSVTSDWVQYTYEFTMDVNRTIIQFDVQTGAGTLWVDDVTVIRTAEVPSAYLQPASTDVYNLTADLGAAPHTYEGWIEVDGTQAGTLIGNYSSTLSAENNYGASYGVQYRNKALEFWLWGGSGKAPQIRIPFTELTLPTNEKFHFAIVSDPAADTVTCYINGGTANGGSQQTVDTDVYIAGDYYSWDTWYNGETAKYATLGIAYDYVGASRVLRVGGTSTATSLTGTKIYSLAMYTDARSQEDVALDMTRVPYEDTTLMAAYDFTAVGNERLEDHSTNNNHLTYSDGTNTESYDTAGMSFDQNVVWYTDADLTAVPLKWTASVNLPAELNDYERGGIIIGNVGNRGSSNNSSFSFEVLAQGQPRIFWNSKLNGKTTLVFDEFDLRTGEWIDLTATIDTSASTVTLTDGTTTQTLSYTNALPPVEPYTTSDANGEFEMEPGWMPLTVGGDSIDGNTKYFRGKIKAVAAYDAAGAKVLSYALTDTDTDGLTADVQWIREFEEPADYDYAMMTVGDTQIVNWYYPDDFGGIYDYIVEQAEAKGDKLKMVMGLGDITEMGTVESEYKRAYEHISKLDGVVDYSLIRGNHDGSMMHSFFPYEKFKDKLTGSYDGTLLNAWRTFTAGDVDYLLLTLDYFPSTAVLEWASDVVGAHPNHTVIVNTHAFLDYKGDLLSTRSINPFTTGAAGTVENIWDILISQHENIQLLLCGHISSQGLVQTTFAREGMSDVNCMLLDPQGMDASIGATGMVDTLYFSDVKADGTVDIELVSYSTTHKEYYGESVTTSITPVTKVAASTDAGSITLSGTATVGGTTKSKEITVAYTGTTTAAADTRFTGQIVDASDNSVLNVEMVLGDGTVTFKVPVTAYPEKISIAAGTVFTSCDNTTTLTIGADYSDTLYTVAELDATNFHIWNNMVADQSANKRTYIYFWSEDLDYDAGDSKWEDMIPSSGLTIYLDGKKCTAMIIGETPNTESTTGNAVAIIYLYESQSGISGVAENCSTIVIPAGTEVLTPDSRTGIRFTADTGLKKVDGTWTVYDPNAVEIEPNEVTVGFDATKVNDNGTVYLPVSTADGSAIMDTYGDWTTAYGTIYVDDVEWTGTAYSITGNYFYMGGLGMNSISKIEIKAGTVLTPDDSCNSSVPIKITNDLVLVKTDGVWAQKGNTPTDHTAAAGPNLPEGKTNLIANPSFTGNSTTGYSITAAASGVDDMLQIQSGYVQSPQITLTAGTTYRLSYYVWVENSTATADIEIYMSGAASATGGWLDFAIKNGANTSGNVLTGVTNAWVEQWIEWTAPADGVVYFGFKDYNEVNFSTNDSTYYVDDICLYDVNEVAATEETIEIDFENASHTVAVNYNSGQSRTWLQVTVGGVTLPGGNYTVYSGTASIDVDGTAYTGGFQKLTTDTQFQIYMAGNGINHGETASQITIPAGTACTYADTENNVNYTISFKNDFILVKKDGAWVKYVAEVTRETISIKKFSWAHSGVVGVNMGNYDTLSACSWWDNYNSSSQFFFANGNVYLDGSDTPTSVRIALPTSTNDNIFFYGMPADGVDDDVDIRIKQGEEFLSEQGEVILVFDKDYTIHKTAQNVGYVTEASTAFSAYNVTLSSDMKVGVQITPATGVALTDLTVSYTLAGGAAQTAAYDPVTGVFYCNVPAKDMTSELVLTLANANSAVQPSNTATTTLRAYALTLLTTDQTDAVKAAAKAMINYGAAAQTYFSYNTDDLANAGYAYTTDELAAADAGTVAGVQITAGTLPESYTGASLLLKSKTGIRLYFTENVGGNLTYSESRQLYYYEFADIGAAELDATQTVTLGSTTFEVSVLSMAKQVIDGDYADSFKDLMKAIALYNAAAKALL